MHRRPVPDLRTATVATAGAYVLVGDAYLFAVGPSHARPTLAVFRLGGHREGTESAWACAAREVAEEAAVQLQPLAPPTTYWLDGDCGDMDPQPIAWPASDAAPAAPLLLVSAQRTGGTRLSVNYLGRALGHPAPSAEICGLLLLRPHEVHRIVREPVSLRAYLRAGGYAILRDPLDERRLLDPFLQLRALSRILECHPNGLCAPA